MDEFDEKSRRVLSRMDLPQYSSAVLTYGDAVATLLRDEVASLRQQVKQWQERAEKEVKAHLECSEEWEHKVNDLQRRFDYLINAIRAHRDARGDDRCWLDDQELYKVLGEGDGDNSLPPKEKFLANCARFYDARCKNADWKSYQELETRLSTLEEVLRVAYEHVYTCDRSVILGAVCRDAKASGEKSG